MHLLDGPKLIKCRFYSIESKKKEFMELLPIIAQQALEAAEKHNQFDYHLPTTNGFQGSRKNIRFVGRVVFCVLNIALIFAVTIFIFTSNWQNSIIITTYLLFCFFLSIINLYAIKKNLSGFFWFYVIGFPFLMAIGIYSIFQYRLIDLQNTPLAIFAGLYVPFFSIFWFILAIFFVDVDSVSVSHPMARIVYFGRYQQLKTLRDFAKSKGWEFNEACPIHPNVWISGKWRDRQVAVRCFRNQIRTPENPHTLFFEITVLSKILFWPFIGKEDIKGKGIFRKKDGIQFGLNPPDPTDQKQNAQFQNIFGPLMSDGEPILTDRSWIGSIDNMIVYQYHSNFRLSPYLLQLEHCVDWVTRVAMNMEMQGYGMPVSETIEEPVLEESQE